MPFLIAQAICVREQFQYLCQSHITTVSQFLNQPQCNRLARVPHMDQGMPLMPHEQSLV